MKIKISALDKKFSLYVRSKADWTCECCGKKYTPPTSGLQTSHFWGRANKSVRFDPENAAALCFFCHQNFTANPFSHCEWFQHRIGQRRFDALRVRKNLKGMPDVAMVNIWLTEKLKEIT